MDSKFGKNYILKIQRTDDPRLSIEIKPPFTLEVDIIRNYLSSGCTTSMRIYNLNESTRSQIRKDQQEFGLVKQVSLVAGYGEEMSTVFIGNVSMAWSVRQGTSMVTHVECFDTGTTPQMPPVSKQYIKGTKKRAIVLDLIKDLKPYGIDVGAIGEIPGGETRGAAYSGNPIDLLRELTGGAFFIDNGKANVIFSDEYVAGDEFVISSETGLLGTPVQQGAKTTVELLFEPKLYIGKKVTVRSSTEKNFNGTYKVIALKHKVTFSQSASGQSSTSVEMLKENTARRAVKYEVFK